MADIDEDTIPQSSTSTDDVDLSDEVQDFRFLSNISREDATIPKRGEKDFEPHSTSLQTSTLAASRQAMHNALSFQRVHQPRSCSTAIYHPETNMAYVLHPKGIHFAKMGFVMSAKDDPFGNDALRGQRLWLLPEEVLYLLERGSLEARWPVGEGEEEDGQGLPMSLQGAYAMFVGDEEGHGGALTLERYSVYAGLKRMGYTVLRAPNWNAPGPPIERDCYAPAPQLTWQAGLSSYWASLRGVFTLSSSDDDDRRANGPLVQPQLYRSYGDIYRRLALIKSHDPTARILPSDPKTPTTDLAFRITFHIWKPGSTTFKKSSPGPPDFRIAVVNARETSMPSLEQLNSLMETVPYDPPREGAQLYQKLKHGYKNVILAVVDQGVVSYLRIGDAGFSKEKLYDRPNNRGGGKRGGRGGRDGRGRR